MIEKIRTQKYEGPDFSGQKLIQHDFSKQNLKYANFRGASLVESDFSESDLSYANFAGANCYGANFTKASLYRVNMMDCILENSIFRPSNVFGITVTLKCETFKNMEIDENWLECWSFFPAMMKLPEKHNGRKPWLDRIIELLGPERYPILKAVFERRMF